MKLTKHRQAILDLLEQTPTALSASAIHTALPHINLVTIYRNLEFLVTANKIKKLNLTAEEALYEVQHTPHHHAVCTDCQSIVHHFSLDEKKLRDIIALPNFDIKDITLTVTGRCQAGTLHQKPRTKTK